MNRRLLPVSIVFALTLSSAVHAQSGSIVQDEHDKRIKADTERNTKYTNNADSYPKSTTSAPNVPTPPARIPVTPRPNTSMTAAEAEAEARRVRIDAEFSRDLAEALPKVAAGDPNAIYAAAIAFENGYGTRVDTRRAIALYRQIADQSDYSAYTAGRILFSGSKNYYGNFNDSVPKDEDEGRRLINIAADHGYDKALEWKKYHPIQIRHLGEFPVMSTYSEEVFQASAKGVTPAPDISEKLFRDKTKQLEKHCCVDIAKDKEHTDEFLAAGKANLYGAGLPANPQRAASLLAVAVKGFRPDACPYLGWAVMKSAQPEQAGKAYNASAFHPCGFLDTPIVNYQRALAAQLTGDAEGQRLFLRAATKGLPDAPDAVLQAFADVGVMELEGNGGLVDEKAGLAHLQAAADRGNRNAIFNLGLIYEQGWHGVAKDQAKALQLFQTAASAGQAQANTHLQQVGSVAK